MPFLVCSPISEEDVSHFLVDIDGALVQADGEKDGAGNIRLHHDVSDVSLGEHTSKIAGCNEWGDGDFSDPFVFTKKLPPPVSGVGLEV